MANVNKIKGTIAILTGGGDVPGLNPAIRAITIRALREGYKVIGLRRGWAGIMEMQRDKKANNSDKYFELTEEIVNRAGRTGVPLGRDVIRRAPYRSPPRPNHDPGCLLLT